MPQTISTEPSSAPPIPFDLPGGGSSPSAEQWRETGRLLGRRFAERAAKHDAEGSFVAENFADLRAAKMLSVAISEDLGGGGLGFAETCELLRELATFCPSTALVLAMHTHLVAASTFKRRRGALTEDALQSRIVREQISLVSTGASDWIGSNGRLEKVDGGYLFSAHKVFASGCPVASIMVTSGRYEEPGQSAQVFHFAIPFSAEGVEIQEDWATLGMRGTGSHSVVLEDVFVPEQSIGLKRPADVWHPVWNIVGGVALPIIMSVYCGIAEKAAALAVEQAAKRSPSTYLPSLVGELENRLCATRLAVESMIALADEYRFEPSLELANSMLVRKTLAAEGAEETVRKAAEVAGGVSFFRSTGGVGLEQLQRDIQAGAFHPLPRAKQLEFSGRLALGLSPLDGAPQ